MASSVKHIWLRPTLAPISELTDWHRQSEHFPVVQQVGKLKQRRRKEKATQNSTTKDASNCRKTQRIPLKCIFSCEMHYELTAAGFGFPLCLYGGYEKCACERKAITLAIWGCHKWEMLLLLNLFTPIRIANSLFHDFACCCKSICA